MLFNPGTEGTITALSLENQWFSLLNLIQQIEQSSTQNPEQRANILTSTLDQDTYILSGNATIYCQVSLAPTGETVSYPDPYVGATFAEGTGGSGTSTNIVEAFVQRSRWLMKGERDTSFNTNGLARKFSSVSWALLDAPLSNPVIHNATLSFNFENIPVESVSVGDGSIIRAKTWLSGDVANL